MALEVTRAFQNACVNRVQQNKIPHSPHQDKGLGTSTRLAIGNFIGNIHHIDKNLFKVV